MNGRQYFEYEYLDELSVQEKSQLSATALNACNGLPIRHTVRTVVQNEQEFLQKQNGGEFSETSTIAIPGCSTTQVQTYHSRL